MSIMSNIVRKALVLWACTARAIDRLHCDRRLRQGRCIGAGGAEFCAFLRCFSGKREKRSGVHRQRLVAVDTAGECQDSLHGALVLPLIEPGALDRPGPGHGPSLPSLAHADGFPFSRSAASRAGRKCRGCARGPTTTAALVSRGCSPGASVVASLAAAAAPTRTSGASPRARSVRRGGACAGGA